MTLHTRLKRAICCPDGCCSPGDCYADGHRDVPVRVDKAAKAVAALLCAEWRANMATKRPGGPYSRVTTFCATKRGSDA